jgi:hypothetical protein
MEDGIKSVSEGFFAAIFDNLRTVHSRYWQKRRLRKMLTTPSYRWRSIKELSAAIGQSDQYTKSLLVEMNARPQAGSPDLWGLEKRVGSR